MRSVVVTFEATDLAAGRFTEQSAGCAVRMYVADEVLEDGLDLVYEILGGTTEQRAAIVAESTRLFDASFKITQDRPSAWRALACFQRLDRLRDHPVYSALLEARTVADRLLLVYEAGMCIMRMDFDDDQADPWADKMRTAVEVLGTGMVRVVPDLGRSLEDWSPLAPPT